jgi:hypothetical protein
VIGAAIMVGKIATGEIADHHPANGKDPAAVRLGRKGGLKGGKARAAKMNAKQRSAIAQKAAKALAEAERGQTKSE